MTQVRIGAGVPAGGEFAAHDRADAAVALPRTGGAIRADELRTGDTIRNGSVTLRVGAVSVHPLNGVTQVSCELGTLVMKSDQQVIVAPTNAAIRTVNLTDLSADEFLEVLGAGDRQSLILGDYFTRDSVENNLQNFDIEAIPDADSEWVSDDCREQADEWVGTSDSAQEVFARLQNTDLWNRINSHGYTADSYDDLRDEAYSIAWSIIREKGLLR